MRNIRSSIVPRERLELREISIVSQARGLLISRKNIKRVFLFHFVAVAAVGR